MERRTTGILYDREQVDNVFYGGDEKSTFLRWLSADELDEEPAPDEVQDDKKYDFNARITCIDY